MHTDEKYMRVALQEAAVAFDKGEIPVGAVVVMENRIIGRGHNLTETLKDVTAHAEMIALTAAFNYLGAKYLPNATIYITLEPCSMCAGALYWSKIGRIVFGASDAKHGYAAFYKQSPFHPKSVVEKGLMQEECLALLQSFFQQLR